MRFEEAGEGCGVAFGFGKRADGVFAKVGADSRAEAPFDGVADGFVENVGEEGDDG